MKIACLESDDSDHLQNPSAGSEWVGRCTGGRVTGREVIAELVQELRGSVAAAEQFEGEMRNLAAYARALAQALDCIRSAGGNRSAAHPYTNQALSLPELQVMLSYYCLKPCSDERMLLKILKCSGP